KGNTVAIFGCGPVGLFTIISAQLMGAGRIFAIDTIPARLEKARELGAEVIDYNAEDPVKTIKKLKRPARGKDTCLGRRPKAVAGAFMNRVQGARRAPWTRFMNAPATAFGFQISSF
ncbi:MAG TPA: zinc-binding dehydrogenase, partial [Ktedonobacteraceae bacterium]|nr:zinc-binding dehydrogenase [Ktedonobacteraceae bacterium]